MTIDSQGVSVISTGSFAMGAKIKFDAGRIYSSGGQVVNAATGTLLGTFGGTNAFAPDSANARAYYLTRDNFGSGPLTLKAFDVHTFILVGTQTITGVSGDPVAMVRWGSNGLALRVSTGDLYVVQTTLIPSAEPIPAPTPTPAATPTPTPEPHATFVRQIELATNDLVYSPSAQRLYASVPSGAGERGNTITPIDPADGAVGTPVFVGSEPNRLALADDNRTLYVSLNGANAVRRFDLQTQTAGLQFTPPSAFARPQDMAVVPGRPQTLAIAAGFNGVAVYDDGVQRPNTSRGNSYAINRIEFGSPATLYGYDNESSGFELVKLALNANGLSHVRTTNNLISGYGVDIKFANGLLYSSGGRIVDPEGLQLIATLQGSGPAMALDPDLGRIFFVNGDSFSGSTIYAFDLTTFRLLGTATLPAITGTPSALVRWGVNGLAFRSGNPFDTNAESAVYVVQSALVSTAAPIPAGVQFGTERVTTNEFQQSVSATVTRTGSRDVATSVDYATADGTAKAGLDYTATSGTLNFAPGEQSKIISVPVSADNVFEGTETFGLTLGNPTGGAVVTGANAVLTIFDDDSRPFISVDDVRVGEGHTGTADAVLTLRLSNASVENVSVNYVTSNSSAAAPGDYTAAAGTINFPAGSTSATVAVKVNGDYALEPDETFLLTITGPVNASLGDQQGVGTIANDDSPGTLQFTPTGYSVFEGGSTASVSVVRVGGASGAVSVNFVTSDLTAQAGSDYTFAAGTLSFAEGETLKSIVVPLLDDPAPETDEQFRVTLSAPAGGASLGVSTMATVTITDDDGRLFQFTSANYEVGEQGGRAAVTVSRTGDPQAAGSVGYATAAATATELSDYNLTLGRLNFAPGETEKSFDVLITDDTHVEPSETFLVTLSDPAGGALGAVTTATVTVTSEDTGPVPNPVSDGFDSAFFVEQHYHDFLNREPDAGGLAFWVNEIEKCGADEQCRQVRRVNVSAAFFLSIEFQNTGYLVYRLHQAAFNTGERLRLRAFVSDTQEIGRGGVVGTPGWAEQLEANKRAFVARFVARPEFASAFQGMTNPAFVDALNANTFDPLGPGTGGALTQAERGQLVADLNAGRKTRAEALRAVAENQLFARRQSNQAFVLMQYFGYLRRNPNEGQDTNFDGYLFWLGKLDEHHGNFVRAEMVRAFIESIEYHRRFGR